MKVLHVINSLDIGGAETLLKEALPLYLERDVQCDVLVLRKSSSNYEQLLKAQGINVFYSKVKQIYSPLQIIYVSKFLTENHYDIVHSHLFPSQYWVSVARKFSSNKQLKLVTTEHNTSNGRRGKKPFYYMDKYIYGGYEKIICISEGTEKELHSWVKETSVKSHIIENGINIEKFKESRPLRKEELVPNYKDGDILIVMTARLTEQKDHTTVIEAAVGLPTNYHILFVGDGEKRSEYEKMVKEKNIEQRVHFLGMRSDVDQIMKTCDAFVLSSHFEGFGLVAVEAMASGLPVIASNVTGLAEVVGDAGVLFNQGNAEELRESIINICENNKLKNEFVTKGKIQAEKYSINHFIAQHISLYQDLSFPVNNTVER